MILILIESTDAFTINDKYLVRWLSAVLLYFNWFAPYPQALKSLKNFKYYLGAGINGWANSKTALILFVKDDSVEQEEIGRAHV